MADIAIGDVVQLKSGGPKMTATQVGEDMVGRVMVWCAWFDKTEPKSEAFPIESVEKV